MSDVCCHSGLPIDQCDYSCQRCRQHFVACPDLDDIRERCEQIRSTWPRGRWVRQSDWPEPIEVTVAREVTDGMRRKTEVHRKDSRMI